VSKLGNFFEARCSLFSLHNEVNVRQNNVRYRKKEHTYHSTVAHLASRLTVETSEA